MASGPAESTSDGQEVGECNVQYRIFLVTGQTVSAVRTLKFLLVLECVPSKCQIVMIKELYSHFYSRNVYSQKSLVTDEEKYVIKSHATDERYFYSFKKKKKNY